MTPRASPERTRALRVWAHLAESAHARQKQRRTLLEGIHLLQAAAAAGVIPWVWFVDGRQDADPEIVALRQISHWPTPFILEGPEFDRNSGVNSAVGVVALIDWPQAPLQPSFSDEPCLVLDTVQDPGNVGTLLRSAAAAGLQRVVLGRGSVQVWSPKVLRAGMGAHFQLRMVEGVDLGHWLSGYRGQVLGALLDQAVNYDEVDMTGTMALVIGNEGAGLSPAVKACLHQRVRIPMAPGVESLNAAVAGSLLLFERQRQQRQRRREGKA